MMIRFRQFILSALLAATAAAACADGEALATYLGNEGVMVAHGDTRVLFDPLFQESFGQYQLVPERLRSALLEGVAPFAGIDAVFVSHHHDDHFDPRDMLQLLENQTAVRLYAPRQAVDAISRLDRERAAAVADRLTALDLDEGDPPLLVQTGHLTVEAVHVPHSGWPDARTDIQNIAFRVSIGGEFTVVHLGDADARMRHFHVHEPFWTARDISLALPPYWFFRSAEGRGIVERTLTPIHATGIHVPMRLARPAARPDVLQDVDLFVVPGETRPVKSTRR